MPPVYITSLPSSVPELEIILREWLSAIFQFINGLDLGPLIDQVIPAYEVVRQYIVQHPTLAIIGGVLVLLVIFPLPFLMLLNIPIYILGGIMRGITFAIIFVMKFVVWCIGFGSSGIVRGSLAAISQSVFYGGRVVAGSLFSILQSFGAIPLR